MGKLVDDAKLHEEFVAQFQIVAGSIGFHLDGQLGQPAFQVLGEISGMIPTPYGMARRFLGQKEVPGSVSNPVILAMLRMDTDWIEDDKTPWCSAFANAAAFLTGFERTRSLAARSWLTVGDVVETEDAKVGRDVVILKRGSGDQPGPDVIQAPGHVGFFAGGFRVGDDIVEVDILGGNQGNAVSIASFDASRILGVRRLRPQVDSG